MGTMGSIVFPEQVRIPVITDLSAFRRWARSDSFPEHGWFSHLEGDLWVDLSMEELVHNLIKSCICTYVTLLVNNEELGPYLGDRMLLTNLDAELSTEPDGMFLSNESLRTGKARLRKGQKSVEVLGTPGMALEVISPSSVDKDTVSLMRLYWLAGITEYWLIDSREELPHLEILRRGKSKYTPTPIVDGWVKSALFGKAFRLECRDAAHGVPVLTLKVR
jgi:Uma2 family endonuclease